MNSNEQYRRALSQGMTPAEAEQEVAEAEEYERVEREMEAHEKAPAPIAAKYPPDSVMYLYPEGYNCCLEFHGREFIDNYIRFRCNCGVTLSFGLNKIPEVDTPMPCGNPNHWAVRYLP